jgi:hypothetical protein
MKDVLFALVSIGCGCVLPIMAIWLGIRMKMNETNKRAQIVMAALEKNPEMDIEALLKKMAPKKLLKEKLLKKLLAGCILSFMGLGFIGFGIYLNVNHLGGTNDDATSNLVGLVLLGIGIAFFINYWVGKKMLAKEMEIEEEQFKV